MKVVLVGVSEGGCGFKSHQIYLNFLKHALKGQVKTEVAYWPANSPPPQHASQDDTIWHLTSQDLLNSLKYISKGKVVITCHDLFALTVSRPFVTTTYRKRFQKLLPHLNKINQIIAVSNYTKEELIDFGVRASKITVINPMVVNPTYLYPRKDVDPLFKRYPFLKPNEKYLLSVGSSIERKNFLRMLMAFKIANKTNRNLKYIFVIDPVNSVGLKELQFGIKSLGLEQDVHILLNVDEPNLARLYSISLGLFYASLAESFGLPIIEAMSCGCPVLCSSTTASLETAEKAALLVNPIDLEHMSRQLKRFINDKVLRQKLREIGLQRSKAFSEQKVAIQLLKLYRSL